jgi:hypothetical protein
LMSSSSSFVRSTIEGGRAFVWGIGRVKTPKALKIV